MEKSQFLSCSLKILITLDFHVFKAGGFPMFRGLLCLKVDRFLRIGNLPAAYEGKEDPVFISSHYTPSPQPHTSNLYIKASFKRFLSEAKPCPVYLWL